MRSLIETRVILSPDKSDFTIPECLIGLDGLLDAVWKELLKHENSDRSANPEFALPQGWKLIETLDYAAYPDFTFEVESRSIEEDTPKVKKILVTLMKRWIEEELEAKRLLDEEDEDAV